MSRNENVHKVRDRGSKLSEIVTKLSLKFKARLSLSSKSVVKLLPCLNITAYPDLMSNLDVP